VGTPQSGQIEIGENVAVQSEKALIEPIPERFGGEADRPRGAAPIGLGHVSQFHAGMFAVAQRLAQLVRRNPQASTASVTP